MTVLASVEPKEVFYYFEEISQIPRGTFDTKAVSDYCVRFAKERKLEVIQDERNNIIIKKPGTKGYEDHEPVIIQGHLDMVCEKKPGSTHDFKKDPLQLFVEDGFVKAKDTTLGADDGIAIAMALAVLDSNDIAHPPIEAVFTVDEEVGMTGALNIDLSSLKGKILLNLDSEDEGILTVGCAGGFRFTLHLPTEQKCVNGSALDIQIAGLKGGHSGVEICRQRGNANKLAGRLLFHLKQKAEFYISEINGGAKDNVIPSVCRMRIVLPDPGNIREIKSTVQEELEAWKKEFGTDEPGLDISVCEADKNSLDVWTEETAAKVMFFLVNAPDGVYEYNRSLEGLVETSDNLGIVETAEHEISFAILTRSGTATKLEEFKEKLMAWAEMLGGSYEITSEYPAWTYSEESQIRPVAARVYEEVFGERPEISTIHAGLECGILSGHKPDLDCISFGPQMYDIHSFHERLDIVSTQKTWEALKAILKEC